eukprot:2795995-Ditylum_brightwellii.AAC.1
MVLLSQAQLVSGSFFPYLEEVSRNRSYVPKLWLGGILSFLAYSGSKVIVKSAWLPCLQQENDKMLMDEFKEDKPGNATLDHLNRVRLYLGATTLADICDDDGKRILAKTLTGKE